MEQPNGGPLAGRRRPRQEPDNSGFVSFRTENTFPIDAASTRELLREYCCLDCLSIRNSRHRDETESTPGHFGPSCLEGSFQESDARLRHCPARPAAFRGSAPTEEDSLYPALYRLEKRGWICSAWKKAESGRRARFYSLTELGIERLVAEERNWSALSGAIERILRLA